MARSSGSRRRAREFALQALFGADLAKVSAIEKLDELWATILDDDGIEVPVYGGKPSAVPVEAEIEFSRRLVNGVQTDREEIDAIIDAASTNWRLLRMPVVDRNILRLAAWELLRCPDIPGTVSVNEAVELAKTYGASESSAFVNGIVDRMGRQLNRLQSGGRRAKSRR